MFHRSLPIRKCNGFIALMSVLVMGAVGVSLMVSVLLLGLGSSRTGFAVEQSGQARALANACAEEGLEQIREVTAFTGSGGLSLGHGNCTYTVSNTGGENRTVTTIGTVGSVVRKISISVTAINPLIIIASWREVP